MNVFNNSSFSNETNKTVDFFQVLMANNPTKILCLAFSLIGILFGPPFLYIIIWYEKFGSDQKRTLLNMYVSMYCWEWIKFVLLVQTIETARFLYGPLPHFVCYGQLVLKNSTINNALLYMDARILTRYIYIFRLKNPAAFKDDFWLLFSCLWIQSFTLLFEIVRQLLNEKLASSFYICLGIDSTNVKGSTRGLGMIIQITTLLHIVIYLRILIYKIKGMTLPQQSKISYIIKKLFVDDFEIKSMTTYASHIFYISLLGISASLLIFSNGIPPKDLNIYPYNLIIYYRSFVAPILGIFALAMLTPKTIIYVKTFIEELKSLYF